MTTSAGSWSRCSTSIRCRSKMRVSALQFPKIETYPGYLYVVLHGIDVKPQQHAVRDPRRRLLSRPQLPGHRARRQSRCIAAMRDVCGRHEHILKEGPVALHAPHRRQMVDNYRPVIEEIEDRIEQPRGAGVRRSGADGASGHEAQTRRVVDAPGAGAAARCDRPSGAPRVSDDLATRWPIGSATSTITSCG